MKPSLREFLLLLLLGAPAVLAQPDLQVKQREDASARRDVVSVTLPVGTRMQVVLNNFLSTRNSRPGDSFYAVVDFPVFIDQTVAIPADSLIRGSVTDVQRAGRIRGRSHMTVSFVTLMLINGVSRDISAEIFGLNDATDVAVVPSGGRVEGSSSKERDVSIMLAAGAKGAEVGAIAGGAKGLAIGSTAGGLAGLTILLANRGRDVYLEPGLSLELILQKPLTLSTSELDFSKAPVSSNRRSNARESFRSEDHHRGRRHSPYPYPWPMLFPGVYFPW